jgi:hypothetical protein
VNDIQAVADLSEFAQDIGREKPAESPCGRQIKNTIKHRQASSTAERLKETLRKGLCGRLEAAIHRREEIMKEKRERREIESTAVGLRRDQSPALANHKKDAEERSEEPFGEALARSRFRAPTRLPGLPVQAGVLVDCNNHL